MYVCVWMYCVYVWCLGMKERRGCTFTTYMIIKYCNTAILYTTLSFSSNSICKMLKTSLSITDVPTNPSSPLMSATTAARTTPVIVRHDEAQLSVEPFSP